MKKSIQSDSLAATRNIARELALSIKEGKPRGKALVIALQGELGVGKTAFVQGLARALGVKENVHSPTFLILKSYPLPRKKTLYHIDCYRLSVARELVSLGWADIVSNPANIVAIEWADKARGVIPKDALWLSFLHKGENERKITLSLQHEYL